MYGWIILYSTWKLWITILDASLGPVSFDQILFQLKKHIFKFSWASLVPTMKSHIFCILPTFIFANNFDSKMTSTKDGLLETSTTSMLTSATNVSSACNTTEDDKTGAGFNHTLDRFVLTPKEPLGEFSILCHLISWQRNLVSIIMKTFDSQHSSATRRGDWSQCRNTLGSRNW